MKWTYSFGERGKAAMLLAIVLVVVFLASVMSKRNVSRLGDSFVSVYEDRLVVESYIYKFSDYLYQKRLIVEECSSAEQRDQLHNNIGVHNEAIKAMIVNYEKTKLTDEESTLFNQFKKDISAIMDAEATIETRDLHLVRSEIESKVSDALENLDQLSSIQVSEGKILNDNSKKIIAGSDVLTQFEMAILIVIGIIIQGLIFASRSLKSNMPQDPRLN